MRTFLLFTLLLCCTFLFFGCYFHASEDPVIFGLGEVKEKQFYSHGGFQDYTDYGIYRYTSVQPEQQSVLHSMTELDMEIFSRYLANFQSWIDTFAATDPTQELVVNYNFDPALIDSADLFYLYTDPDYPVTNGICGFYKIYFFDTQTLTLYYFRNNI